jgi:hypothetical protein
MPLLYRSMPVAEDGFPVTDWRGVGIREDHDIFIDEERDVHPGSGGMSVFVDPMAAPPFRRPPSLGGDSKHPMWSISSDDLGEDLEFVQDGGSKHGAVEPITTMSLTSYLDALAETREGWTPVQ